ncbi:peptidase S41, partial [Candidatus Desantisbacteria bacterium CG23_combo_of_CG06-09_8_20_14_all_40_23]
MKNVLWFLALAIIVSMSVDANSQGQESSELYDGLRLFGKAFSIVHNQYVEDVKTKTLVYGAIDGMLKSLGDPHTRFMTPEVFKEMKVETEGSFSGLGIVIGLKQDNLMVISPIEGTPAYLAGIKAGDYITEIDGTSTKNISLVEAVQKLRGKQGTQVIITIKRDGVENPFKVTINRAIIEIHSVKSDVIQTDVGYIRITNFNQNTAQEFTDSLVKLQKRGIRSLVIDLRNDPGGLLESAIDVSDNLLSKNSLIVSIAGRQQEMNREFRTTGKGLYLDNPIIVLLNEGSASASEILAGAIKDNKRGLTIGVKSYGKGSVQTVLPLPDGSGIALTTAKYFTPSGVCIHGKGIIPDIIVEMPEITPKDQEMWLKLDDSQYLKDFAKGRSSYTDEDIKNLQQTLSKNKIELSEMILRRAINIEIGRLNGGKEIVCDLKCDPQLQRAVDI